jgi:KaiC/GvpD/RAD55 family RecA-like ATPase
VSAEPSLIAKVLLHGDRGERVAAVAALTPIQYRFYRESVAEELEVTPEKLDVEVSALQAKFDHTAQQQAIKPYESVAINEAPRKVHGATVQGLLGERTVNVFGGVPNAGKTFFAIDLALHIALGRTWFGRKVKGGPVLYVAAEAPSSVVMRAKAAVDAMHSDERVPWIPLYVVSAAPALGSYNEYAAECERLIATLKAVEADEGKPVVLIIIDTLASVLGTGEENGDGMRLVGDSAKFLALNSDATVVFLHHPSKGDATSLRGHSSMHGTVDTIISITSDEATGIRTATVVKARDFPAGVQVCFELSVVRLPDADCFGDPMTTCVVKAVGLSQLPKRRPGGKVQEQILNELERLFRTGETHWDEATVRNAAHTLNVHRNTVPKALKALRTGGFIIGESARMTLKYPPESM